jgi:hypothetical protein
VLEIRSIMALRSYSVIFLCHHEHDTSGLSKDQEYVHPSSAKMWRRMRLPFSSTKSVMQIDVDGITKS